MVIKFKDTKSFKFSDILGQSYNPITISNLQDASIVNVDGNHPEVSDLGQLYRFYLVLNGEGLFTINGNQNKVSEKDFIIIEPNASYKYEGKMELFEFDLSHTLSETLG